MSGSQNENETDKTGARNPDLPPEEQGVTQDEANKAGDLSDQENQRAAINRTLDVPGDARELGDVNRVGEHEPPEAAERGGAQE